MRMCKFKDLDPHSPNLWTPPPCLMTQTTPTPQATPPSKNPGHAHPISEDWHFPPLWLSEHSLCQILSKADEEDWTLILPCLPVPTGEILLKNYKSVFTWRHSTWPKNQFIGQKTTKQYSCHKPRLSKNTWNIQLVALKAVLSKTNDSESAHALLHWLLYLSQQFGN